MQVAQRDPSIRFLSLAHLIDEEALVRAYQRQRKDAAVGVDGVTKEQYGQNLEENIRVLHDRLKAGRYRHKPIRRVHIPKENGTRPIGVSSFEDKLVQDALREVLEAVYEPLFLDCSYGFRPGRGAHDALRSLDCAAMSGRMSWTLEADIKSYFDKIPRKLLMEMLSERVADTSFLRLVGKCLHVGVLDGDEYSEPEVGTAQGSVLSPLHGNVYLHKVLDEWFATEVVGRLKGRAHLIRYADDFIIGFEVREDAERVMRVLELRMAKYGLTLHSGKTRIVPFQRPGPTQGSGKGPATFDFLGFTVYWRRTRRGKWALAMKTRMSRLKRTIQSVRDFCRRHRHEPVKEQRIGLARRLTGHFNYFGVNGNKRSLAILAHEAKRAWRKWLNRRSQRGSMTWARFGELLKALPLPEPTIRVQLWGATA
jgi:group II intron reverse transcriptase/maturase